MLTPHSGAEALLQDGREHERGGRLVQATEAFLSAVALAERGGHGLRLSEAYRLLAVVFHRRRMSDDASACCTKAIDLARAEGDARRTAEALNTLAAIELELGDLSQAAARYQEALTLASDVPQLCARIRQNLGIVANIQGEYDTALAHYEASLEGYRAAGDDRGCVIAYHNLGMISADRARFEDADRYFWQALQLATAMGDEGARALCLINLCEVLLARRDFDAATRHAEKALAILESIGQPRHQAEAYKVLGIVAREVGDVERADANLKEALRLAAAEESVLVQAETWRELSLLARQRGHNQDALRALNQSRRLFQRVDARVDLVDVAARVSDLEGEFLTIVREWGESIESADLYTHGHCVRVAEYAIAIAQVLQLDEEACATIRVGAYLHDLGKVRVPPELLTKPGRLTDTEFDILKRHPEDGVAMLGDIEFPWDIVPIIRSHHEKYDGTGYPEGLSGDAISLHAQIVCMADVFDALTTNRSYRDAMAPDVALGVIQASRRWWRPDVFEAFLASALARGGSDAPRVPDVAVSGRWPSYASVAARLPSDAKKATR